MSALNLIAFTANRDLHDSLNVQRLFNVYVADLNLPQEPCLVKSNDCEITSLEWSEDGTRLLLADSNGNAELWTRRDYLIDQWHMIQRNTCFAGERVLSATWFRGTSRRLQIDYEKRDLACSYGDKFVAQNFGPTVKRFGGRAVAGYVTVSNSGIVWAGCVASELDRPDTSMEKWTDPMKPKSEPSMLCGTDTLGQNRIKIKLIDHAYSANGDMMIAVSNGNADCAIHCYRVHVSFIESKQLTDPVVRVKSSCWNSFYSSLALESIDACSSPTRRVRVTQLRFVSQDDPNVLIVACECCSIRQKFSATDNERNLRHELEAQQSDFSMIELWELKERPVRMHQLFVNEQMSSPSPSPPMKTDWQLITSVRQSSSILALATAPQIILDQACARQNGLVAVAASDGSLRCLSKDNLSTVCFFDAVYNFDQLPIDISNEKSNETHHRRLNRSNRPIDLTFTWSQSVLISLGGCGRLAAYRLQPICADGSTHSLNHSQALFEFSLVSGHDWLDVLLATRSHLIEPLCERLSESFQRQPVPVQQQYSLRLLLLKAALFRCVSAHKAGDCHAQLLLYSIAHLLRQLLRSREPHERDGPAEQLSAIIQSKTNELQINKIFIQLEHKEFCVESSLLQSLQHLNQWIGDLSLFLVASLPQQCHSNIRFPGVSCCSLLFN